MFCLSLGCLGFHHLLHHFLMAPPLQSRPGAFTCVVDAVSLYDFHSSHFQLIASWTFLVSSISCPYVLCFSPSLALCTVSILPSWGRCFCFVCHHLFLYLSWGLSLLILLLLAYCVSTGVCVIRTPPGGDPCDCIVHVIFGVPLNYSDECVHYSNPPQYPSHTFILPNFTFPTFTLPLYIVNNCWKQGIALGGMCLFPCIFYIIMYWYSVFCASVPFHYTYLFPQVSV